MAPVEDSAGDDGGDFHGDYETLILAVACIGVLIAAALLLVMVPWLKAYKSFLQRLVLTIVVSTMLEDGCRAAAWFYPASNTTSQEIRACQVLGVVTLTFHWYTYNLCLVWTTYLLVIVCVRIRIQPRGAAATVKKQGMSKTLRVAVELGFFAGLLLVPVFLVLWIPFILGNLTYGFEGFICTIQSVSNSNSTANEVYADLFELAPIVLTGLFVVPLMVGMAILYCLKASKLKEAKEAIRNLFFLSLTLIGFFGFSLMMISLIMKLSRMSSSGKFLLYGVYLISVTLGKFVLIIGYLLVFNCSKKKRKKTVKFKIKVPLPLATKLSMSLRKRQFQVIHTSVFRTPESLRQHQSKNYKLLSH